MRVYIGPGESLEGTVRVPGSKNYTTRYIWASALSSGESTVLAPAWNDDALALLSCCRELGAESKEENDRLIIKGFGRNFKEVRTLDPGNGGLVLRLLLAFGLLLPEVKYITSYPESLGKRPQGDLLKVLRELGAEVEDNNGCLPITVRGKKPLFRREIEISGRVSSQFATALMFIAPLVGGLSLRITGGLSSRPPLATTLKVMEECGIPVAADWEKLIFVIPGGEYIPGVYRVPGDYPAASALLAAASVLPSRVALTGLLPDDVQGEKAVLPYLKSMGVRLIQTERGVEITGSGKLRAVDFQGDEAIDAVLSMGAVAALATGTTRFRGVANLRYKESDRISDFAGELRKLGVRVEEFPSEFQITGNPGGYEGGVTIDAHHDHRIVMAFSVLALRTEKGLVIDGAEHVKKSYPDFFRDLRSLGATVKVLSL